MSIAIATGHTLLRWRGIPQPSWRCLVRVWGHRQHPPLKQNDRWTRRWIHQSMNLSINQSIIQDKSINWWNAVQSTNQSIGEVMSHRQINQLVKWCPMLWRLITPSCETGMCSSRDEGVFQECRGGRSYWRRHALCKKLSIHEMIDQPIRALVHSVQCATAIYRTLVLYRAVQQLE